MKILRDILIITVVFQLIIPLPVLAAAAGEFSAVIGDVTLMRKGRTIKPTVKTPIETKDTIKTGKRAMAKVLLTDGSILTIAQSSRIEVKDYLFQKQKRTANFSLYLGKLRSQVKKHFGRDSSYYVYTPTAVAGIRGSDFVSVVELIGAQETPQSTFCAIESTLTVYNSELPAQVVNVDEGYCTVVAAGAIPSAPSAFSPAELEVLMGDFVTQIPTAAAGAAAGATAAEFALGGIVGGTITMGLMAVGIGAAAIITATTDTDTVPTPTTHTPTVHH
jgi:hypothetical protein